MPRAVEMVKKDNSRMQSVERWAQYVKSVDDKTWSKLQSVLIDSQIINARKIRLSKEQVNFIKKVIKKTYRKRH